MIEENPKAEIITFYSFKGGTGRTLALANIACLLAKNNPREKVLMIDWDLEAPGLHRYFRHRRSEGLDSSRRNREMEAHPGLIDLFIEVEEQSRDLKQTNEEAEVAKVREVYEKVGLQRFITSTSVPGLDLMTAGRSDEHYGSRVNSFDWEALYARSDWLIRMLEVCLKEHYRYILIDSRTGLTDTSNICTTLLPDKLVVVFTPNRQSLTGVRQLVQSATGYRSNSNDMRPLMVFPLASRVEASRQKLRHFWRFAVDEDDVTGFQPMFEGLLKEVYALDECSLDKYFKDVQIQQEPDYAYGEEIAVMAEESLSADRFSLTESFHTFYERLLSDRPPWAEPATDANSSAATAKVQVWWLSYIRGQARFWRKHERAFVVGIGIMGMLALIGAAALVQHSRSVSADARLYLTSEFAKLNAAEKAVADANLAAAEARNLMEQAEIRYTNAVIQGTRSSKELVELRGRLRETETNYFIAAQQATRLGETVVSFSKNLADATVNVVALSNSLAFYITTNDVLQRMFFSVSQLNSALQTNLFDLSDQLSNCKLNQGWKEIYSAFETAISDRERIRPLRITDNVHLWPVNVRRQGVEFVVRTDSAATINAQPGKLIFRASLPVRGITNFSTQKFEYRVRLDGVDLPSDGAGSGFEKATANAQARPFGRESVAYFTVDERPINTRKDYK